MSDHGMTTIAAIATPPGPGGIAIIRLSGPAALAILQKIFNPKSANTHFSSHRLYYGWIVNPESGQIIDEVLAVYMGAPHTYTREDVVEIHCHGSFLIAQDILQLSCRHGARLADPGEFTKCAFLNGRIDLSQAEAVLELLKAKTQEGVHLAINQLQGRLYNEVERVRDLLISIKAIVEVAIDFPDDEEEILKPAEIKPKIMDQIVPPLTDLISAADNGKIFREGIAVVIAGRPNVGKSSLLNALLREDRAIVTPVPGTTRDTIEECLNIKGMPVRIIDTAGVRGDACSVEEIGIQRTREKLAQADLALLMLDSSGPVVDEDIKLYESLVESKLIVVANKMDIGQPNWKEQYVSLFPDTNLVEISAKHGNGIDQLESIIFNQVTGQTTNWDPGHQAAPNLRQQTAMVNAVAACERIIEGFAVCITPDLIAIEVQTALDHLGDIVGLTTTEDVLDAIFGEFCIGK